ncbi:hypothetical protein D2Q93_02745 [Alicyclobacillaceae bacterium I2511]|nr:hypothetical protein D2Q93_02745 [Alicyclobacillaceae bacterium I2511]
MTMESPHIKELHDPLQTLTQLFTVKPDAVLLNPGLNRISGDLFFWRCAPARILNMNTFVTDSILLPHELIQRCEDAVRDGFDAIKVLLPWDTSPAERMHSIQLAAQLVRECENWEMPLII